MSQPGFWDDRKLSQSLSKELQTKKHLIDLYERLSKEYQDASELLKLSEQDHSLMEDLIASIHRLQSEVSHLKALLFLNGKYDTSDVLLSIHSGAGGKDAQDFAQMLLRMYLRYSERVGFKVSILDESHGEEVGLKSATLEISGTMAYGFLKAEHGVHRLVRLSPFNAKNTRETSFALVEVVPVVDVTDVVIDPKDLRIDTYRAGGKGGQNVNKTDSAVRITHLPTNTVVQCQNERSQLQNKEHAMKMLLSKLIELQEQQNAKNIADIKGGRKEIAWGNQIRSYVLQPYTMVKDHRTGAETGNVQKVLDGDIDMFIEAYLVREN